MAEAARIRVWSQPLSPPAITTVWLLLLITLSLGVSVVVTAQAANTLNSFRWKNRPLLVFAPSANHSAYREQVGHANGDRAGFRDRDMVLVEVPPSAGSRSEGRTISEAEANVLRAKFGVGEDQFALVLVGKDGREKERWLEPTRMTEVFRVIDGMPMRQREMRKG